MAKTSLDVPFLAPVDNSCVSEICFMKTISITKRTKIGAQAMQKVGGRNVQWASNFRIQYESTAEFELNQISASKSSRDGNDKTLIFAWNSVKKDQKESSHFCTIHW